MTDMLSLQSRGCHVLSVPPTLGPRESGDLMPAWEPAAISSVFL